MLRGGYDLIKDFHEIEVWMEKQEKPALTKKKQELIKEEKFENIWEKSSKKFTEILKEWLELEEYKRAYIPLHFYLFSQTFKSTYMTPKPITFPSSLPFFLCRFPVEETEKLFSLKVLLIPIIPDESRKEIFDKKFKNKIFKFSSKTKRTKEKFEIIIEKSLKEMLEPIKWAELMAVVGKIRESISQSKPIELKDVKVLNRLITEADEIELEKIKPYFEEIIEEIKKVMGEEWYNTRKRWVEILDEKFDLYKYVPEKERDVYIYYFIIRQYYLDKGTVGLKTEEREKFWRENINKLPELPAVEKRIEELVKIGLNDAIKK